MNKCEILFDIGQYVGVAISNCNKFYIGEIVREDNILEISFPTDLNGDNRKFIKASNPKVETAHQDQLFQENLELQINGEVLTCTQPEKTNKMFIRCKAKLLQEEKIEKEIHTYITYQF